MTVPPGTLGVPVRLADPTALGLVHPGDHVDLLRLARDNATNGATTVASGALVLDVTAASDPTIGGLLLALSPAQARQAAGNPQSGFAVLIRPA